MKKKVTFVELKEISDELKNIVNLNKDYDFDYVYNIRKILKKVKSEMQNIRDCLEDNVEGFSDYQQEVFELGVSCNAEKVRVGQGFQLNFDTEDFDKKKFIEQQKELEEKYKKTLEKQKTVQEKNQKIINNQEVKVDFPTIPKDAFSDELNFDELPDSLIDLIE